jgi:hypothetical protein
VLPGIRVGGIVGNDNINSIFPFLLYGDCKNATYYEKDTPPPWRNVG